MVSIILANHVIIHIILFKGSAPSLIYKKYPYFFMYYANDLIKGVNNLSLRFLQMQ